MKTAKTTTKPKDARLAFWTLLGLVAGISAGIFFGELCSPLSIVGDVFVGLLRMTILPYIIVALVANFGRLSAKDSRRLAFVGLSTLLALWLIALSTVFCFARALPEWKQGSFFSTAITADQTPFDLVAVFIPSNVFTALSDNHIPAVVLLCIWGGLSLAGIKGRKRLISQLDILAKVLMRISRSVAKLAPIGVFAIAASTAGVTTFEEFGRLQAYLVIYSIGVLFLAFIALPLIVTTFTPFRYRDVLSVSRDAMLTAFATGKLIIVLPMLIEQTEQLFRRRDQFDAERTSPTVDVLYPVAYPFPHAGKLLSMLFVPFAAWFLGNALSWLEYPAFLSAGTFSYFGGPTLAVPFLLDLMRLPHDMFQLFLLTGVLGERLGDALGVMHLVVFTLTATCAFTGRIQLSWLRVLKYILAVLVSGLAIQLMTAVVLNATLTVYDSENQLHFANMELLHRPVASKVIHESSSNPAPLLPGESILERVRRRGIIRIGFNEDKLPFAYINSESRLVGMDVDLAHAFARDLGVTIEFVRFDRRSLADQLANDDFDVVMSGLVGTLERSEAMQHTDSHMAVTLSLVAKDHEVRKFQTLSAMRNSRGLRIGFVDLSRGYISRLQTALPHAELVELATSQEFFQDQTQPLDALLVSAETGSAYTLLHPEFEVVIPKDLRVSLPLFYAIGNSDEYMTDFLEHWITLRRNDGTFDASYDHWILGKTDRNRAPRWCVVRDVLHWID